MRSGQRTPTVLMTADAVGGVWNYALGLCAALPDFRFVLAVMGPPPGAEKRAEAARLGNVVLEQGPYRLEWMDGAAVDLPESRAWLAALARRHDADLLHVNGYAHAACEIACPRLVVAHSDVVSWWRAVHSAPPLPEWDAYRREVVAGLRAASRVVAIGNAVLADLRRHYEVALADALVIPNGIDLGRFGPGHKRPLILAAGRVWDEAKNLAVLDAVAGELPWPVEIAGDAMHPQRGAVQLQSARGLGVLSPKQLASHMAAAAIYAAPARYEPFGLGILEAAASGCALVLGDIPSLRENWDGAAVFVAPDDRAGLAAALCSLIADPSARQRLVASALQRASRFSLAAMGRRYQGLYSGLLAQAARRKVA